MAPLGQSRSAQALPSRYHICPRCCRAPNGPLFIFGQAQIMHDLLHHPSPIPPRHLPPSSAEIAHRPIAPEHDPLRSESAKHSRNPRRDTRLGSTKLGCHGPRPGIVVRRQWRDLREGTGQLHIRLREAGELLDPFLPHCKGRVSLLSIRVVGVHVGLAHVVCEPHPRTSSTSNPR